MDQPTPQDDFVPSGFFTLRTPLLPFDELLAWSDGLAAGHVGDDPAHLQVAFGADHACLRERLRAVFRQPATREALFVASPDLQERMDCWYQEPDSEQGRKIERALVRYFARMAGRATPFGLFSGCSVGTVGQESRLRLAARACYRRHTRLDMDYLVALTDALARRPDLQQGLTFGVNSSLYFAGGRFRYCEVRRNGKGWTHHQIALEASNYLEATLARAAGGACPEALVAALCQHDPEAAPDEARTYIGDLIDNQVLVPHVRPAVTGPEPIHELAARLRRQAATPTGSSVGRIANPSYPPVEAFEVRPVISEQLEQVRQELEAMDATGVGVDPAHYRCVTRALAGLSVEIDRTRLFQVDMFKPVVHASLGPPVLAEIMRGVKLLQRLTRRPRDERTAQFRKAFRERYEGREVPLIEALDEETGVGFDTLTGGITDGSSLLDELTFPKTADEVIPWGRREACLLRKLSDGLAAGDGAITLEPRELEEMAEPSPLPLPDAFAVMVSLAAASEEALAGGAFQVLLHGVSGPSGARLLGRFCHADAQLHRHVQEHVQAEEALQPDAVFAEIVHLPEGRLGNILARPILRAYEIPYLGHAGVPVERQIPVTDLRVSVSGEEIIVRSARLGRRIIPRLTSAHNFHLSQGIYRFLCALQAQGTAGELTWDWGPLREARFLPRVTSGRLVLSRASWRMGQEELKKLGRARAAARFAAVQSWRSERRLPRWIAVVDADNELPLDLDNVLAVDTLVELIKSRAQVTLVELFPGPGQLVVRGPEGAFVHELVIPFVRCADKKTQRQADKHTSIQGQVQSFAGALHDCIPSPAVPASVRHSLPPGSEWLYAKLYAGPAMLDQILREAIRPLVETLMGSGAAERWFFVRYGDPDWHLRLRFQGEPVRLHAEVLPALQTAVAPLLADGRLWRFQLDTYAREIERYGGAHGIELAEKLFHADSEAVLALAELFPGDARGDLRWRLALLGMDLLLSDLGFDLNARRLIARNARDSFRAEFHADAGLKQQLGAKYRPQRRSLEALLEGTADARLSAGLKILRRRSQRLAPVAAELRTCERAGRLSISLAELAPSYLHMHANRLLRSAQRAQELVLYDFLSRLYDSQAAGIMPADLRRPLSGVRLG